MSALQNVELTRNWGTTLVMAHVRKPLRTGPVQTTNDFPSIHLMASERLTWNLHEVDAACYDPSTGVVTRIAVEQSDVMVIDGSRYWSTPLTFGPNKEVHVWLNPVIGTPPPGMQDWALSAVLTVKNPGGVALPPLIRGFQVEAEHPWSILGLEPTGPGVNVTLNTNQSLG